jgi:flagellar biosynthesis protein FlhB
MGISFVGLFVVRLDVCTITMTLDCVWRFKSIDFDTLNHVFVKLTKQHMFLPSIICIWLILIDFFFQRWNSNHVGYMTKKKLLFFPLILVIFVSVVGT